LVNGKPITYFLEDMRYSPTVEVANFTRYTAAENRNEFILASGYITGGLKPLIDKVNKEERIPWLDGSYSTEIFGPEGGPSKYPYYYSLGATYGDQFRVLLNWIKEDSKGKGKVAIVYSPTEWGHHDVISILNGISLKAAGGEISVIIGPNGAGKTSLLNCINSHYSPQEGEILFQGENLLRLKPHIIAAQGIARTFQKVELFHGMSALDNIKLGRHFLIRTSLLGSFFRWPSTVAIELRHRQEIEEEDGHLYIFDRFKDIMALGDGSRFAPQDIELRLKFSPYIKEAVVCGANQPFVTAIISIDLENVGNWAKRRGISYTTYQDLSQRPEVYELVREEIRKLCQRLPQNMRVRKFAILLKELHPDDEELTRTRKVRRGLIYERYKPLIEDLYRPTPEHLLDIQIRYEDGRISSLKGQVAIAEVTS